MPNLSAVANSIANGLWNIAPGARTALQGREVRLVAHRGAHGPGLPLENTLAAFELCAALGVWAIETDIRMTRDGEPVICHDPDCARLHGRPDIVLAEVSFAQLRAAVPAIPHLSELVAGFAGRIHLMLEVKESWRERPDYPAQVADCLAVLEPERDYHLLSLVPDHLEGFDKLPRSACVDVAWMNAADTIRENIKLGHGGVAGSFALLGRRKLRRLRQAGRKVGTGFVTRVGALRREVYRGADWIFTDHAIPLQRLINAETGNTPKQSR
jgi:glycerophosphoryl diester phosphodiesterase